MTISNLDIVFTFDQLTTKLLSESARQTQRTTQFGDEEALVAYSNRGSL